MCNNISKIGELVHRPGFLKDNLCGVCLLELRADFENNVNDFCVVLCLKCILVIYIF
jgi:hypothetical protein